jgi:hypothetical protein
MTKAFSWQQSYQDALLEMDLAVMRTKLRRALSELENRNKELMFAQDAESITERQAITDALNGLRAIERSELTVPLEAGGLQRSILA